MTIATGTNAAFPGGRFKFIQRRDYALMHRIHHWSPPEWVRFIMVSLTRCGDGWLWYALAVGILVLADETRWSALLAGFSSSAAGLGIYGIAKRVTRRTRPCLIEPNHWARILPPDQYSFPSGHTITSFAAATSVGLFYPALMPTLMICAFFIAISRIMLGMHFLSDVVVGVFIGTSLGYCAYHLMS